MNFDVIEFIMDLEKAEDLTQRRQDAKKSGFWF